MSEIEYPVYVAIENYYMYFLLLLLKLVYPNTRSVEMVAVYYGKTAVCRTRWERFVRWVKRTKDKWDYWFKYEIKREVEKEAAT